MSEDLTKQEKAFVDSFKLSIKHDEALNSIKHIGNITIGEAFGSSLLRHSEQYSCAYETVRDYITNTEAMKKKLNALERFFYLDFSPANKLSKEEKLEHSQLMNKIIDTVFKKVGDEE